eukprot:4886415-Pleurochrysis_carterae.AAC.1
MENHVCRNQWLDEGKLAKCQHMLWARDRRISLRRSLLLGGGTSSQRVARSALKLFGMHCISRATPVLLALETGSLRFDRQCFAWANLRNGCRSFARKSYSQIIPLISPP